MMTSYIKRGAITIQQDAIGNLLIKKPASSGMEKNPPILLQGHMDMVCVSDLAGGFDFHTTPIPIQIQSNGEWVDARGTSLGADDGIGVSIALALLFDPDPDFIHGPIEILITVDEETGLSGAFALDVTALDIRSHHLINIDSEDLGIITIGSAGGGELIFEKNLEKMSPASVEDVLFLEISIEGLLGGQYRVFSYQKWCTRPSQQSDSLH